MTVNDNQKNDSNDEHNPIEESWDEEEFNEELDLELTELLEGEADDSVEIEADQLSENDDLERSDDELLDIEEPDIDDEVLDINDFELDILDDEAVDTSSEEIEDDFESDFDIDEDSDELDKLLGDLEDDFPEDEAPSLTQKKTVFRVGGVDPDENAIPLEKRKGYSPSQAFVDLRYRQIAGEVSVEEQAKTDKWGYGWVLLILFSMFGTITVGTWLILLKTRISLPNILVNVSIISLLFFLGVVVIRYMVLILLSFLHHARTRDLGTNFDYSQVRASILVPGYNEGRVIENTINMLLTLDYPNYEVIIIDDGSTDDTLEQARQLEGWQGDVYVKVLTQRNQGKAAALNNGLRSASGQIVVCMDADSFLSLGTLKSAIRHFIDPDVAAVAGNVKVINRINLMTRLQALEYIEGLNLVRRAQAFLRAVNIIPGPIGLFRRDALLEMGGWENDTYAEDCDLTLKLLSYGKKIEYEPEAISFTEAPQELQQLLKQRYRWTRGILQSMRKHKGLLVKPSAGWRVTITLWQMVMEAILWPLMNIMAIMLFLMVAILFGMSPLIVLWWVQLTILDTIAAMHTVAMEKESLSLVFYAIIYRVFFIPIVDFAKLAATLEELFGARMNWGKLERIG